MKRLSRIIVLAAFAVLARAEDFSGKVVAITDGDTIKVVHEGAAECFRLLGCRFCLPHAVTEAFQPTL